MERLTVTNIGPDPKPIKGMSFTIVNQVCKNRYCLIRSSNTLLWFKFLMCLIYYQSHSTKALPTPPETQRKTKNLYLLGFSLNTINISFFKKNNETRSHTYNKGLQFFFSHQHVLLSRSHKQPYALQSQGDQLQLENQYVTSSFVVMDAYSSRFI